MCFLVGYKAVVNKVKEKEEWIFKQATKLHYSNDYGSFKFSKIHQLDLIILAVQLN